jgi:hypothetical protein
MTGFLAGPISPLVMEPGLATVCSDGDTGCVLIVSYTGDVDGTAYFARRSRGLWNDVLNERRRPRRMALNKADEVGLGGNPSDPARISACPQFGMFVSI